MQKLIIIQKNLKNKSWQKNDVKELVAEKWGLDAKTCTISISHYKGDNREPQYTSITVKGQKPNNI